MQISDKALSSRALPNNAPPLEDQSAISGPNHLEPNNIETDALEPSAVGLSPTRTDRVRRFLGQSLQTLSRSDQVSALVAAAFLVAVPVFIQAPLVRLLPEFSLCITALWLLLGWKLLKSPSSELWGDLVIGFSWTWLAGAIYWGWFRWNPYIHLPIEALGLPMVLILMRYGKAKIGNYFYLGSLLGTTITDLYFYCVGLIPYWQQLMVQPPTEAGGILHRALLRMETYQGVGCAIVLLSLLIMLGTIPLRSADAKWWAFSGAVLSTILVDSLFFVVAILA